MIDCSPMAVKAGKRPQADAGDSTPLTSGRPMPMNPRRVLVGERLGCRPSFRSSFPAFRAWSLLALAMAGGARVTSGVAQVLVWGRRIARPRSDR